MIQGSIPSDFRNMTQMRNFLCNGINELSFDLEMVSSWSGIQHLVISETATRGTIPADMLTNLTNISTFLMARTQISSTVPAQSWFPPSVDLSGSRLSGVLPPNALNIGTRGLLINDLKLSGSIPSSSARRAGGVAESITVSASRNHFTGKIPADFNNLVGFETLILSGNLFSCNAPGMDEAVNLGVGEFVEPVVAALQAIGVTFVAESHKVVTNPFASLSGTYKNTVHIFAGNSQLSPNAGRLMQAKPASRVVLQDQILQGRISLFTSQSAFWQYFYMALPAFMLIYTIAVVVLVRRVWPDETGKLSRFFWRWDLHQASLSEFKLSLEFLTLQTQLQTFKTICMLVVGGVLLMLVNALASKVYSHSECINRLMFVSIASVEAGTLYQYVWVLWCCFSLGVQGFLVFQLTVQARNMIRVHPLLIRRFSSSCQEPLTIWRQKIRHHKIGQQIGYWVLVAVVVAVISSPTFGFILAKNMPSKEDDFFIKLLANAGFIAVLDVAISELVTPAACIMLAELKHGVKAVRSISTQHALPLALTTSRNALFFEIGGQILAPITFQLALDESCLRSVW